MSAGYGRGYYGSEQLAKPPKKRSWFTWVAVLGAGAGVVWFLWPKKTPYAPLPGYMDLDRVPASASTPNGSPLVIINTAAAPAAAAAAAAAASAAPPMGAFMKQLEDDARAHGFTDVKNYEDSVVATAKELQTTGAKVILAPHLQHLAAQLGPS